MPGRKTPKKAKSKSQQRLMGMVYAYKEGNLKLKGLDPELAKKIRSIAKNLKLEDAEKMASTKHKKLPEKVKESMDFDRDYYVDTISVFSNFNEEDLYKMSDEELIDLYNSLEIDDFDEELKREKEMYNETHIRRISDILNEEVIEEEVVEVIEEIIIEEEVVEEIEEVKESVVIKFSDFK